MTQPSGKLDRLMNFFSVFSLADKTSTSFTYSRLRKGEIRIFSLQPGDFDSPISIVLEHRRLDQIEKTYQALSYAWGNPTRDLSINCNGRALKITSSLEIGLRYLRLEDRPRVLWADAICINQDDQEERSEQVPLMRYIYPKAECVVVWLGEEDSSTASAVATFENLATLYQATLYHESRFEQLRLVRELFTGKDRCQDGILAAADLTYRPWFDRCWAFQEIVLARDAQILCGNFLIPWTIFDRGLRVLHSARHLFPSSLTPNPNAVRMRKDLAWRTKEKAAPRFLSRILGECQHLQATNPRDRIFALLGLIDFKDQSLFEPRYDMSVCDTYILYTRAMIKEEQSLCVLSQAQRYRIHEELPSWVPDWSQKFSTAPIGRESQSYADAAGYKFAATYSVNLGIKGNLADVDVDSSTDLSLQGAFIDTVAEFHGLNHFRHSLSNQGKSDSRIHPIVTAFAEEINLTAKYQCGPCTPEEVLFRTLSAGIWYYTTRRYTRAKNWQSHETLRRTLLPSAMEQDLNPDRIPLEVAREVYGNAIPNHFLKILSIKSGEGDDQSPPQYIPKEEHQDLLQEVIKEAVRHPIIFSRYRVFFFTNRGYIGIGPESMKHGDMLCTLFGSDVPFVLRPIHNKPGKFKLIGECYVDGIMDGELFKLSEDRKTVQTTVDGVGIRDFTLV